MKYLFFTCVLLLVACAPAAAAGTYAYADGWGSQGTANGQFSYPSGIAVDDSGNIYVADSFNHRIQKFTSSGEYMTKWGTLGTTNGKFATVVDVAIGPGGEVYVSDASPRIQKFNSIGGFQLGWGSVGNGVGQFAKTSGKTLGGIAVDAEGNVYAADTGNNRIEKFDANGGFLLQWGSYGQGKGQFDSPFDVAVDGAGTVYVADRNNHRVQMFTSGGEYTGTWTGSPDLYLNALWGITTGPDGSIFVTDENSNLVQQFDATGTVLAHFGESGSATGQFNFPRGVAVDARGSVYVVDRGHHRIEKFEASGPVADAGGPYTGLEGTAVTLNGDRSTGAGITTYEWDFENDGIYDEITNVASTSHTWTNDFTGKIGLRVTDDALRQSTDTADVSIANVAPAVTVSADAAVIDEGDTFTGPGSFIDPGADIWTATVDFGDGSGAELLTMHEDKTFVLSHTYKDNGAFTVTVVVNDDDTAGTATLDVTVNNIAPTVEEITAPTDPRQVETVVTATASFSDPGVLDTHTAVWDWGDGTTSAEPVTESEGSGSASGSHSYPAPGIYAVSIQITDNDQGTGSRSTAVPVVIYDPNGGFVTGGGWFTSPEGAYPAEDVSGKAHFAFVSKYKKDETEPASKVTLEFKAVDLGFESTGNEWLVVSGSRATYLGTGTVNGDGNHRFLLSVVDGSPDLIRIKIWNTISGITVYDNQMGANEFAPPTMKVGSGNIVVHN